jgi:hypothetical protein
MTFYSCRSVFLTTALCLFGLSCKRDSIVSTYVEQAAASNKGSVAIDIPLDNQVLTAIAKGRISTEYANNQQKIVDLIRDLFLKSFEEKTDQYGHKKSTVVLTEKIAEVLFGTPDIVKLGRDFEDGIFKNIKLYTNENVDPLSNKGDKVPNYQVINRALRKHSDMGVLKQKEPQVAKLIQDFEMSYSPLPRVKGLVYRGTGLSTSMLKTILDTKEMRDLGYTSTSIDVADAFDFMSKRKTTTENVRVFMAIYGYSGKFIPFGEFSREEEVLFPHGSKFRLNHSFRQADEDGPDMDSYYLFFEEIR